MRFQTITFALLPIVAAVGLGCSDNDGAYSDGFEAGYQAGSRDAAVQIEERDKAVQSLIEERDKIIELLKEANRKAAQAAQRPAPTPTRTPAPVPTRTPIELIPTSTAPQPQPVVVEVVFPTPVPTRPPAPIEPPQPCLPGVIGYCTPVDWR